MEDNKLFLVYVNPVGKNVHDLYEYEFFFSETPETTWGEDWNEQCPSACGPLFPDSSTYNHIERLTTIIPFACAQENSCFSMQDCIDGIIALAYEDISEYEEYPEPFRIVFQFGEDFESVEDTLARRHQFFSQAKPKITTEENIDEELNEEEPPF